MAKSSGLNFNLPSVDDLFSTEEERAEARLEKVVNLSPAEISDFPNHPFKVRMDEAMQEMTESVKQYGVLVPTLVRPKPEGGYEMLTKDDLRWTTPVTVTPADITIYMGGDNG